MLQSIIHDLEAAIALIISTLVLFIIIALLTIKPAIGNVIELGSTSNQISHRCERVLTDETGNKWEVMLFTPVDLSPVNSLNLRLSGLYSSLHIQPQKPLIINTSSDRFEATDLLQEKSPLPSIGQYDLQQIFPQLSTEDLLLEIPLENGQSARLPISKAVVRQWQEVARSKEQGARRQES
jgi:hypothetical protein